MIDYKTQVNPTFYTAQTTLLILSRARNQDAIETISDLKNVIDFTQTNSKLMKVPFMSEKEIKDTQLGAGIAIEARYETVSSLLKKGNYKNVLDIACGYTPRGLFCQKLGIDYVGFDVPVVIEKFQARAEKNSCGASHISYYSGDASNAASLMKATELFSHPENGVFITCEGLLNYLSHDEQSQLISGIRSILKKYGGAWYSSDFSIDYDKFVSLNIEDPEVYKRFIELKNHSRNDIYFTIGNFKNEEEKIQFLENKGLNIEKVPFFNESMTLNLLKQVSSDKLPLYLDLLKKCTIWKMTLNPNYVEKEDGIHGKEVNNLNVDYSINDGTLVCHVEGRIDTVSAPTLLEIFDTNSTDLSSMKVDAEKLEFISSAGLRVLGIAANKLGSDSVTVENASDAVKKIFKNTGFDKMILIK